MRRRKAGRAPYNQPRRRRFLPAASPLEMTSKPAPSASRLSHSQRIQQVLEAEIFSGALPPGARLDEVELAARFQVSRTPVREALRHLASAGLVQVRSRQPAQVVELPAHKLVEMFQVMAELEGLCARLAARRITPAQIAALNALHQALVALADTDRVDDFYEVNRRFHELIYEAAQNEFLAEQTRALRNRVGAYRRLVTHRSSRRAGTLDEHAQVLRCIVAGDEEGAAAAMRDHVNLLGEKLLDFIALFPRMAPAPASRPGRVALAP
ncbi:GntR family transcriptional regulator [Caldimonas thermodepolymerans]|jgi:Transcriptional regulators|uniref:GntR family transcriptional regulator n=2 Tax=Caldimonas thermodepolymerans TaxID=215580 RepID=A0AA46HWM7_9BURK|nr:GntR family transcriptional regulator [Caldimonas thermodepolymerans]TCP08293.1 GntR family transcriptional regulator [Caldimonas thermodepolymerans]